MVAIWTVGHSTLEVDAFADLVQGHGVEIVADIRSYPGSRRYPWFGKEAMPNWLADHNIGYRHYPGLGGRKHKVIEGSGNDYWTHPAFRSYADYAAMAGVFQDDLRALVGLASRARVAIMCAEAVWWKCHRRIVTDYLIGSGLDVLHIMGPGKCEAGRMTAGARWNGARVAYHGDKGAG